jgi:hypothetical protein
MMEEGQAVLAPNVLVREQVITYTETAKREWAEAERRWRAWQEEQGSQ